MKKDTEGRDDFEQESTVDDSEQEDTVEDEFSPQNFVWVDGAQLLHKDGKPWFKDTDLAKRAGLKNPRDIRSQIIPWLIRNRVIVNDSSVVADGDDRIVGSYRTREVPVRVGTSTGTKTVTEYWLDERAATHCLFRMNTPMAVHAQQVTVAMAFKFRDILEGKVNFLPPVLLEQMARLTEAQTSIVKTQADISASLRAQNDRISEIEASFRQETKKNEERFAHPDRYRSGQEIRDNESFVDECYEKIASVARHQGTTWRKVHGQLIRRFRVSGYKFIPVQLYREVQCWLDGRLNGQPVFDRATLKKMKREKEKRAQKTKDGQGSFGFEDNVRPINKAKKKLPKRKPRRARCDSTGPVKR